MGVVPSRWIVVAGTALALAGCDDGPAPTPPPPTSQPAPDTRPTEPDEPAGPVGPATYLDVLREADPNLPDAPPLDEALPLEHAAAVVLGRPVLLDAGGAIWLTHPDGIAAADIAVDPEAWKQPQQVVRETVVFAVRNGRLIEPIVKEDDGYRWFHATGSAAFELAGAEWSRAIARPDGIAVPTATGAALVVPVGRPDDATQYERRYGRLPEAERPDGNGTIEVARYDGFDEGAVHLLPASDGVVAWTDATAVDGDASAAAYWDGETWTALPAADGWARHIVHLVPYADGSVLQIADDATLSVLPLSTDGIDKASVEQLVGELSRMENDRRSAAAAQLEAMGPGVLDELRRLREDAGRLATKEIDRLLAGGGEVTLGGMIPMPGEVRVASRFADGGAILVFEEGVEVEEAAGVSVIKQPGYVLVQPGRRIGLLPDRLRYEADLGGHLLAFGGDFVSVREGEPPLLWGVNHFSPMLGENAAAGYATPIGRDAQGRWLFAPDAAAEARPSGTLLVDPFVASPDERPPTWVLEAGRGGPLDLPGMAGRGPDAWPAMKLGGAWRLVAEGWETLPDETVVETSGSFPTGGATVDGQTLTAKGRLIDLPPGLRDASVRVAMDGEGQTWVLGGSGDVLRVGADGEAELFEDLLPAKAPRLAWVDPAGRLCVAYGDDAVAVIWTSGIVPPSIRRIMPVQRRVLDVMPEGA